MVTGWVHWIVNVSKVLQITLDCKKKTSTSLNRRERPVIRTGSGTTERERQMDRTRDKEGGRMCTVFYEKEDKA